MEPGYAARCGPGPVTLDIRPVAGVVAVCPCQEGTHAQQLDFMRDERGIDRYGFELLDR